MKVHSIQKVRLIAAALGVALTVGLGACSMPAGGGGGGASPTGPVSPPPMTPTGEPTSSPSAPSGSPINGAAAAHCRQTGGTVQLRQPTFGTNNDESTWVELGDPIEVCRWQMGEGQSSTRMYADLVTTYSSKPTLAALAYLAKKPLPSSSEGANPASLDCTALEGAGEYGTSLNGGGLVAKGDPTDVVVNVCMFADGSFLDAWGIAYYSAGTVRGKDLTTVFRFDRANLPPVFTP